ncbi:MAG: A/G-specific adenine glycosylase [Candidatus Bipolaricaulia bacterium]
MHDPIASIPDPQDRKLLTDRLMAWYERHRRDLPWRRTQDPYQIWVSETMLQQTQVETVRPYYQRFIERFPTVEVLADASLEEVLKVWEGLGYYARARNLHRAAKIIVERYGRQVPDSRTELLKLPGIGRYTAGAILSIAFGKDEAIVDGNVRRVLCRLFAIDRPVTEAGTQRQLWTLAKTLLPRGQGREFNQALMELGATVCIPKHPRCLICPVAELCEANRLGLQAELPINTPKRDRPHYDIAVGIIWHDEKVLIAKRPENGLLGGLWEFPGGKRQPDESLDRCLVREVKEELDIEVSVSQPQPFIVVKHGYTHFHVTLHVFHCTYQQGTPQPLGCDDWRWVRLEELPDYAFPVANHRIIKALQGGERAVRKDLSRDRSP